MQNSFFEHHQNEETNPFILARSMSEGCVDPRKLALAAYIDQVCKGRAREATCLFKLAQQLPKKLNLN